LCGGGRKDTHRVLANKLERRTLEDLVANGRIMLKWILKNQDDRGRIGVI